MRLTKRDVQVLRDLALSHVLSRDQVLALGYYTSVTRLNTRFRDLMAINLVKRLDTPFFGQSLYRVTHGAAEVLGSKIGALVANRSDSPRFLQHALMTTNTRIALLARGAKGWRFEQQLWASFSHNRRDYEVRPDGFVTFPEFACAIEVDLGQVNTSKVASKLAAYEAFLQSNECLYQWGVLSFRVLIATTSDARAETLASAADRFDLTILCLTFDSINAPTVGAWS